VENFNIVIEPMHDKNFISFINKIGKFDIHAGPWIAGGSVRKVWQGLDWRHQDVDVFFRSKEQIEEFKHNLAKLSKRNSEYVEYTVNYEERSITSYLPKLSNTNDIAVEIHFTSDNAITFSVTEFNGIDTLTYKLQIITKTLYNHYTEVINTFDFTICQFLTDGKHIYTYQNAIDDCKSKHINMVTDSNRETTPIRILKYMAYGFTLDDLKFFDLIEQLTVSNSLGIVDDY